MVTAPKSQSSGSHPAEIKPKTMTWKSWILPTLLVIAGVYILIRLGFWQLDRLAQRRALNATVQAQLDAPPLDLNGSFDASALPGMEYRSVTLTGLYDFEHQVALRNQANGNMLGVHLLTPLKLDGSNQVALVDRGWVPQDDLDQNNLAKYNMPGQVTVTGVIRRSQTHPVMGRATDPAYVQGQPPLPAFYIANVERIAQQLPYPVLPVYIQQTEPANAAAPPYPEALNLQLDEGPHLGYAIQWFAFAGMLALGYPFFIRSQIIKVKKT